MKMKRTILKSELDILYNQKLISENKIVIEYIKDKISELNKNSYTTVYFNPRLESFNYLEIKSSCLIKEYNKAIKILERKNYLLSKYSYSLIPLSDN